MELSLLQHPADMLIVVRGPGIRARMRMAPRTRKIRAILRLQEGDQGHLAHCRDLRNLERAADRASTYALDGARSRDPLASLRKLTAKRRARIPNLWDRTYGWKAQPVESQNASLASANLAVQDAVGLRNRDARLAKPLDDGVVQVAADRQGLFHIGDDATQFEFQRAVREAYPEAQEECPRWRRLHNLGMSAGEVGQDFTHLNRIAVIGDDDLDHDAAQCIRARPVLDDAGDEFRVRNHHARSIESLDLGCAHTNAPHPSLLALDHDRVADADRPFGQQDEAGYEIRHDGLQPKPDTDRKGAGNQRNLLQVEAQPRERDHDRRDRADIAEDRDDRELEAGLQSGPRQQLRLQPTLHDARDDEQQQKDKSGRQQRFKR